MKKKVGMTILTVCFMMVLVASVMKGTTDASTPSYTAGKNVAESLGDGDEELCTISGYPVTKGEVLVEMNLRISGGDEEAEAVQATVEELSAKKVLYAEAVRAGFQATDEEYAQYVKSLKESLENVENSEVLEDYYKGFGGEDNYWKVMEPTIRQNLSIRNYLDSMNLSEKEEEAYKNQAFEQASEQIDMDEFKNSVRQCYDTIQ